jgi:hypothetical protein
MVRGVKIQVALDFVELCDKSSVIRIPKDNLTISETTDDNMRRFRIGSERENLETMSAENNSRSDPTSSGASRIISGWMRSWKFQTKTELGCGLPDSSTLYKIGLH